MLSLIVAIVHWIKGSGKDTPQECVWSENEPRCPWCLSTDQSYVAFTSIVPPGTYRCTACNRVWCKVVDKTNKVKHVSKS